MNVPITDPPATPLATVFKNRLVTLLAGDVGALVVEHGDGYRRVLDADESDYIRTARAAALANGVPASAFAAVAGDYLFQVCMAARHRESETWTLVFRTVSAERMGEIIAENYQGNKGDTT